MDEETEIYTAHLYKGFGGTQIYTKYVAVLTFINNMGNGQAPDVGKLCGGAQITVHSLNNKPHHALQTFPSLQPTLFETKSAKDRKYRHTNALGSVRQPLGPNS